MIFSNLLLNYRSQFINVCIYQITCIAFWSKWYFYRFSNTTKGEVIRATNCCNLQRNIVALQVEKRCWPYYHPPQTMSRNKSCCCKLKQFVEKGRYASSNWSNMLLQLATTKLCCVTMFEVGGNTCNNASQLATQRCVQVGGKCCPYYRALTSTEKTVWSGIWSLLEHRSNISIYSRGI